MEQTKLNDNEEIYVMEVEQIVRLLAISDALHAGSDRERDLGHKLWLIVSEIQSNQMLRMRP